MKVNKFLPYIIAIVIFIISSLIYFHPVLKGEKIPQSDITQFSGMAKEINEYRVNKNKEPYWTGAAFSGMPAYQVSAYYPNDFVRFIDQSIRFLPRPADYTFLYFLSFFVLLLALNVDWKLGVLGALTFGFSTYLIIIFVPGHNAKAHAIGYMPLVLAGVLWVFQKRYLLGFIITGFAMALEIYTNHPQMTYYLGFCLLILGIIQAITAIKEKKIPTFIKQSLVILVAVLLGIGVNSPRMMSMKEYATYSTRGKSELTVSPDGSKKEATKGLDKSYITQYSYAKLETFNLFIPRFMGGGTVEELNENSNFYKILEENAGANAAKEYSKQVLTYWGDQPIIEAPAYIGAVIFFLFFLGIFIVKGWLKQWLLAATIFSVLMSWGRNFEILTNFFIDYVPLYTKFRAVSSIQVIAELCVPVLGILALKTFFSNTISSYEKKQALKKAMYTFGGLIVAGFLLAHASSTFQGLRDSQYTELPGLVDAVIADRKAMLFSDTIRSLILMLVSVGLLWLLLKNKLHKINVIFGFAILVLFDLISINKQYVNADNFVSSRKIKKPFVATNANKLIMQDTSYYRVANFSTNPMQDASTSYFHNSIGGYHAAKMGRYNELFDYQIAKNNMQVLNMLNTKYFIIQDKEGQIQVQQNSEANGNVWFVQKLKIVKSANEELQALDSINTKEVAVFNNYEFGNTYKATNIPIFEKDSIATIQLTNYDITSLTYQSKATKEQFAVFSEIYYKNGWNAYIDGILTPHCRVNYVLRGMVVPAGNHTIDFKFEPKVIEQGKIFSLTSYTLLFLIPLAWFFYEKKLTP